MTGQGEAHPHDNRRLGLSCFVLRESMKLGRVGVESGCFATVLPATLRVERAGQNEVSNCLVITPLIR
jgi:hypothetical protein